MTTGVTAEFGGQGLGFRVRWQSARRTPGVYDTARRHSKLARVGESGACAAKPAAEMLAQRREAQ